MTISYEFLRVLIVEDNPHMRTLLRSLLYMLGVKEIHESTDGASGFAALEKHEPDLALTDLAMKPVDGLAFTLQVRNDPASPNPYLPIVMVTAYTDRQSITAARDAGVTEIVAKPITVHSLSSRIAAVVEKPRPFVRSAGYFGPDRRRRTMAPYRGPRRRSTDTVQEFIEVS